MNCLKLSVLEDKVPHRPFGSPPHYDLELRRRGYTVNIGKTPTGEIDFIATRQNDKLYVQVTEKIEEEATEHREFDRLLEIRDNYPKYVLRTDEFADGNHEGIKVMHVADFS